MPESAPTRDVLFCSRVSTSQDTPLEDVFLQVQHEWELRKALSDRMPQRIQSLLSKRCPVPKGVAAQS